MKKEICPFSSFKVNSHPNNNNVEYICTTDDVQGFRLNGSYMTKNGIYDMGCGITIDLSKFTKSFKKVEVGIQSGYLTINTSNYKNVPFIGLCENLKNGYTLCYVVDNINIINVDIIRDSFNKRILNDTDKHLIWVDTKLLKKVTPYWFINSQGKICHSFIETENVDVLRWRQATNNVYEDFDSCQKYVNSIKNW